MHTASGSFAVEGRGGSESAKTAREKLQGDSVGPQGPGLPGALVLQDGGHPWVQGQGKEMRNVKGVCPGCLSFSR